MTFAIKKACLHFDLPLTWNVPGRIWRKKLYTPNKAEEILVHDGRQNSI